MEQSLAKSTLNLLINSYYGIIKNETLIKKSGFLLLKSNKKGR